MCRPRRAPRETSRRRRLAVLFLFVAAVAEAFVLEGGGGGRRALPPCEGKRRKVDREEAYRKKKAMEAQLAKRRAGRATDLAPSALVVGESVIVEDHRHEQFFFDDDTLKSLDALAQRYDRPLIACAPALAAAIDRRGGDYLLLDRDDRFQELRFREFELTRPAPVDVDFDAVFLDPPFANVTPRHLARAVDTLLEGLERPLFVGYNVKRETQLLAAFAERGITLRRTERTLSYATGVMTGHIALFANDLAINDLASRK
mmetsp:Transcript_21972/g.70776  ORF Transcript_21972/g.70776 Transcript_21972/m.70776 type:complete len:259 (-) Transcript_21972:884-1660(-)